MVPDPLPRFIRWGEPERERLNAMLGQDSLFYQAMLLGQYEVASGWRRIDEYLPAVRAVTAADVLRVAQTYLRSTNRTTAVLIPDPPVSGPSAPQAHPHGAIN